MAAKPKKIKKKTNRAAAKRFSLTASGEVRRARAMKSHNTGQKARKRKRRLRHETVVSRAERRRVTKLITS
jgi:large subunit ribosomal protein L35